MGGKSIASTVRQPTIVLHSIYALV